MQAHSPALPPHTHTLVACVLRQLPSADSVEYWRDPDKAGWLQSQGDMTKMWRRRWFVLKQGYLFRFMNSDVTGGCEQPAGARCEGWRVDARV